MHFVSCENPKILAFTRQYEEQTMLVVVNLSRYTQPAELDLGAFKGYVPVEVFSKNKFPIVKEETSYFLTLGGHDCEWFVLEKEQVHAGASKTLSTLTLKQWQDITHKDLLEALENVVLPSYMINLRWFGGKGRVIEGMKIINHTSIPAGENGTVLLLIEVTYQSGLPETYQLPIAFGKQALAFKLKDSCPKAVISQMKIGDEEGILYDALYGQDLQEFLINSMAANQHVSTGSGEIVFHGNTLLQEHINRQESIKPKVLSGEQSNTSLIFGNRFFLKMFRKVDRGINPDLEITQFLTEHAKFKHIPAFAGSIEWRYDKGTMVLGLMQEMVESSSDAWTYMLERLEDYNERVLAHSASTTEMPPLKGSITAPVGYEDIPDALKEVLETSVAEQVRLLGVRTGEMHKALASGTAMADFKPEAYSLHYQRSLYAGLQSLVRSTFISQGKNLKKLADDARPEAEEVLAMKDEILEVLKGIYKTKIDVSKIRIHGDYHLGQVLFTGKDFVITDFEGEPARTFSNRRLKRSPLRDVAGMLRSFHYAAYASLFLDGHFRKEDFGKLIPYLEQWSHYMGGFFMKAYVETVQGCAFMPKDKQDLDTLMTTFLLEKAIYELNYELNNRPGWVTIPLRGIKSLMKKHQTFKVSSANVRMADPVVT
jgi:maltose alpha-D-glucosyltransferase/alpha-amylase